jgi:hypothetical protein
MHVLLNIFPCVVFFIWCGHRESNQSCNLFRYNPSAMGQVMAENRGGCQMRTKLYSLLLATVAWLATSCGDSRSVDSSETNPQVESSEQVTPEQACLEYIEHIARFAERCQIGSYQAIHDEIHKHIDCNRIKQIRDEELLYEQCWPYFDTVSCTEALAISDVKEIPDACQNQLLM